MVFFFSRMSLCLKVKAHHNDYILYSWGHSLRYSSYYGGPQLSRKNQKPHGKTKNLTAKVKTSRQKQKPHGKSKNLTAKSKYPTTKPKTSRQNQRPHGKTKYFTAKTKYPTAKANTHGKTKAILLTVKYLVLPWGFWFCLPWGILFLPWGFCFCRDTVVGHHTAPIWHKRKTF